MEVPSFADLGKNAKDVFKTGYHHGKGLVKFNVKTKSAKRFQMMSDATLNFDESKVIENDYHFIQIFLDFYGENKFSVVLSELMIFAQYLLYYYFVDYSWE